MKREARYIALLRGINVGGHNRIPMPELRTAAAQLGWTMVQTYIQSGNLVFSAVGAAPTLENQLEQAIEERFGLKIPVIIRSSEAWSAYVTTNPFLDAAQAEPKFVALALSKAALKPGAGSALETRATAAERVLQSRDAFWIHFPQGFGKSKLPAQFDRCAGSPVTARNWLTVLKLREMLELIR